MPTNDNNTCQSTDHTVLMLISIIAYSFKFLTTLICLDMMLSFVQYIFVTILVHVYIYIYIYIYTSLSK